MSSRYLIIFIILFSGSWGIAGNGPSSTANLCRLSQEVQNVDQLLPPEFTEESIDEVFIRRENIYGAYESSYQLENWFGQPTNTLTIHRLFKGPHPQSPYASNILLADLLVYRMYFLGKVDNLPGKFMMIPTKIIHEHLINVKSRGIFAEYRQAKGLRSQDPIDISRTTKDPTDAKLFKDILHTTGTNGNATLRLVEAASILEGKSYQIHRMQFNSINLTFEIEEVP